MDRVHSFIFPDIPEELSQILNRENKKLVIIGVIGKSIHSHCNKMAGFNILKQYPELNDDNECKEGKITFYFKNNGNSLYIHFETTYDYYVQQKLMEQIMDNDNSNKNGDVDSNKDTDSSNTTNTGIKLDKEKLKSLTNIMHFNSYIRTRFARYLLFAIQICHIIVMVETSNIFDSSYLSIFKSLKAIREKYILKFLPKLLKNTNAGIYMGKHGRLCSPRFIFFFEKCLDEYESDSENLQKLEFEIEDCIYKMLRNEFIITNNSSNSLFSIPRNKRFVCINTDPNLHSNSIDDAMKRFSECLDKITNKKDNDIDKELDDFRPFEGFAKPYRHYKNKNWKSITDSETNLLNLLDEHVTEAIECGFDDSMAKFKGKSRFAFPNTKLWYETFNILYEIFIENPDKPNFQTNDPDYSAYIENFHKYIDIDERFFLDCCEQGLELAIENYNEMLPHHYNRDFHAQKFKQSYQVLLKYAREPHIDIYTNKLKEICDATWMNGKQQCEYPSLRGNLCIMPKHTVSDPTEHSSGVKFVSICNCGRTQGRRDDPYTIKQANYDFYNILTNNCNPCQKLEKVNFAIFEPSIHDYRAAEVNHFVRNKLSSSDSSEKHSDLSLENSPEISVNHQLDDLHEDLSLSNSNEDDDDDEDNDGNDDVVDIDDAMKKPNFENTMMIISDSDSVNEIIIKVGDKNDVVREKMAVRLPSTTEYLPSMLHTSSPMGLLPQFPSWSLMCIGPSSIYSHSTGLPEHVQSGFLSGANYLLPWDVQVRLENAASWAASYERSRYRKKPQVVKSDASKSGQTFVLKIFVGCEYECPRGHRFIMTAPDKILRAGSSVVRDNGGKVVFNDMPLYFPCPCRNSSSKVAQLMRVHVVTPKAPVNVILQPQVRPGGKNTCVFVTGLPEPPKLTQSAYWILRFPYIYQNEDGPIMPPAEITAETAMSYGCLLSGMYGIAETTESNT